MRLLLSLFLFGFLHAGEWIATEAVLTAYCPCAYCCGHRAQGITANGTRTREHPYGVAADQRSVAFGSAIWIPQGIGYLDAQFPDTADRAFAVDDTGGAVVSKTRTTGVLHLDLRFIHHRNAVKFGVKTATIYVWQE